MDLWWDALATPDRIFWGIALVTSAVLVLQLLLSLIGLDGHGDIDADLDTDIDHGGGMGILSVRTVTAFFTGFGWGGVIALDNGFSVPAATLAAVASGGTLMLAVYALMRALFSLRYSGTLDYRNAVGVTGSVYLPIPGNMGGPGQVEVLVQGRLMTVQAFTRSPAKIPNRARIKVVDVVDQQTLLVEPLNPPPDH